MSSGPDSSDLWYKDGLRFACTGCGRCCRGPGGYVWVTEDEAKTLAKVLLLSFEDFAKQYLRRSGLRLALVDGATGDCVLLDTKGRCKAYEHRPVQCRTWPWWPENLETPEDWAREKENCPGLDTGKRHTLDQILDGLERAKSVD